MCHKYSLVNIVMKVNSQAVFKKKKRNLKFEGETLKAVHELCCTRLNFVNFVGMHVCQSSNLYTHKCHMYQQFIFHNTNTIFNMSSS